MQNSCEKGSVYYNKDNHLEKLEAQFAGRTETMDFVDEIDTELMRKREFMEKINLCIEDYEDL